MQKHLGFTILELVIVIIVVGILASLPFFNWPSTNLNLDGQAQLIASDIRFAQSLAMSKADRYRFSIATNNTYQILDSNGNAVSLPSGTTATLNSGIVFSVSSSLVAFDGRGTPYSDTGTPGTPLAAAYSISISGGGGTKTISVTPITGRVIVQ